MLLFSLLYEHGGFTIYSYSSYDTQPTLGAQQNCRIGINGTTVIKYSSVVIGNKTIKYSSVVIGNKTMVRDGLCGCCSGSSRLLCHHGGDRGYAVSIGLYPRGPEMTDPCPTGQAAGLFGAGRTTAVVVGSVGAALWDRVV